MFEKVVTVGLPSGSGPDAITPEFSLPSLGPDQILDIEAWMSNFGGSNVHIFPDAMTVSQCQQSLERGAVDVLMTLPSATPGRRHLPVNVSKLTVFFEAVNNSGQFQLVTVVVCNRRKGLM